MSSGTKSTQPPSPNARQVGGTHYKAPIQHWDWAGRNGLRYLEGCATKYVVREGRKPTEDPQQDLQKAAHYVEKLLELHLAGELPPRGVRTTKISDSEFASANELTKKEARFVHLMHFWANTNDLLEALAIVNGLIS